MGGHKEESQKKKRVGKEEKKGRTYNEPRVFHRRKKKGADRGKGQKTSLRES